MARLGQVDDRIHGGGETTGVECVSQVQLKSMDLWMNRQKAGCSGQAVEGMIGHEPLDQPTPDEPCRSRYQDVHRAVSMTVAPRWS